MAYSLYWTSGLRRRNFGDAWLDVIWQRALGDRVAADLGYEIVVGGGSILSDYWLARISDDLMAAGVHALGRALMLGPGLPHATAIADKAEPIRQGGVVDVLWVRGPRSHASLGQLGIHLEPLGDAAYLWPAVEACEVPRKGRSQNGETLVIPHALVALDWERTGVLPPGFVSPWVDGLDVAPLIQRIASASFVATGSLHVAICAHMNAVPFAFVKDLLPDREALFKYED